MCFSYLFIFWIEHCVKAAVSQHFLRTSTQTSLGLSFSARKVPGVNWDLLGLMCVLRYALFSHKNQISNLDFGTCFASHEGLEIKMFIVLIIHHLGTGILSIAIVCCFMFFYSEAVAFFGLFFCSDFILSYFIHFLFVLYGFLKWLLRCNIASTALNQRGPIRAFPMTLQVSASINFQE